MPDAVHIHPLFTDLAFCEDGLPLLHADAFLPRIDGRGSRRFNRYYDACGAAFENWCRHKIFPQVQLLYRQALNNAAPLPQWQATLKTAVTFHKSDILSLYTETTLSGTPQRTVLRRADTWDLRRSLPVSVAEFFPSRTPWRSSLLRKVAEQIRQQEAQGIALYNPHWNQQLRRAFRPQHFYLSEQGLCLFFPACTIAPAAEGIPTFCLPYNEENGPRLPK